MPTQRPDWEVDGPSIFRIVGEEETLIDACERARTELGLEVTPDSITNRKRRMKASGTWEEHIQSAQGTPAFDAVKGQAFAGHRPVEHAPDTVAVVEDECRDDNTKPTIDQDWCWEPGPSRILEIPPPKDGIDLYASDIHFDTHLEREMDLLVRATQDIKPDIFHLGGDIWDFFSIAKFQRSPGQALDRLQKEFDAGRPYLEEICKASKRVLLELGNHEVRLFKLVAENPGLHKLRALNLKTLAGLPDKVEVVPYQTLVKRGRMHFYHGEIANQNTARATFNKLHVSCVVGHAHRPEVQTFYVGGRSYQTIVSGTFQDPRKVCWTNFPSWTCGFVSCRYYEDKPGKSAFAAQLHLLVNGTLHMPGYGTYR